MGIVEIILIAVGLAMDAFAVSICKGLLMKKLNIRQALVIALYFGGFQAIMPLLGWLLGSQFHRYIVSFDHWIAFALLAFLGGKTVLDTIREKEEDESGDDMSVESGGLILNHRELFVMAIATSIDALAVGITMAFLQVSVVMAASVIGMVTFVICIGGVWIGNLFGSRMKKWASLAGGIILIAIGLKILLEHLGFLGL